jgi:Raf kinase inhibitor-like YbhB/YbcL family protein
MLRQLATLGGLLMTAATFSFTSAPFMADGTPGGKIALEYTCEGDDLSPPLSWEAPPAGTKSQALIVDDPDAPGGVFTHWVLYGLAANTRDLRRGMAPAGARQGKNDFGTVGYRGPCPPPGKSHRYVFTLYALDQPLDLPAGASVAELQRAMKGHVVGQAKTHGMFGR